MYLTDKDWKRLESIANRIVAAIQQQSQLIQDHITQQSQILFDVLPPQRAQKQTRFDETANGGLFTEDGPPKSQRAKRPPRQEAQYVATPTERQASLKIEATQAESVSSAVEALRKMRGDNDK